MGQPVFIVLLAIGTALFTRDGATRENETPVNVSSPECRYSVAYSAPDSCPDTHELERRLGGSYRVVRGTMASCPTCVRGVVVQALPISASGYRLQLTGLESTSIERQDCSDLTDLAAYAIEASDLPTPECRSSGVRLGASAASLYNLSNRDPLLAVQLRTNIPVGAGELTPFGFWLPAAQVGNQVAGTVYPTLNLEGYGAGLDACWSLEDLFALHELKELQVCGAGLWRRFTAGFPEGHTTAAAHLWSLGGSLAWRTNLFANLHLEVAPSILTGLNRSATYYDNQHRLYQYGGIEAQLRVGFSWGLVGRSTPNNVESLRAAHDRPPGSPSAATSPPPPLFRKRPHATR